MYETENKKLVQKSSIVEKLQTVSRITKDVLAEVEMFAGGGDLNQQGIDFYAELRRFEVRLLSYALMKAEGNQRRAARILHIKFATLNAKVKKYRLSTARFPAN